MPIKLQPMRNRLALNRIVPIAFLFSTISKSTHSIDWTDLGNQVTSHPSFLPSQKPSLSSTPSYRPSSLPSWIPSMRPSHIPSSGPSTFPSNNPTTLPTANPTYVPSTEPTKHSTRQPSSHPSLSPSISPSTSSPSRLPTLLPSFHPTHFPTLSSLPSKLYRPSVYPSSAPSLPPSISPTIRITSTDSSSPSIGGSPTRNPSEKTTSYLSKMNQTHASAPFITNDKKVQRAFLMEIVSDKLMNKNDIQHFEIEAFNLVTSSCQSLNYNMDIMSVTFNDQTFSLAGGILIISFTIEGKSTNIGDSDNDEPEQNIVKCFETNYNNLQNNVNTATGFFDGIDIEKVEGTKFPTMIVSIIGGCCFFVLAAIFLVDRNLRRKRRTSKKDKTCRNDKNTSNKNEKEQPKRMLMRKVDAHDDLERNISIYDPDSSYKMIGCAKPSSRLEVDTHSRHMPISESPRDLQEIVIQTLTPLAQDYDSSSLDDRYGPNYRDEKRLYSSRAHQLNSTTADRSFSEDSHKVS